MSNLITPSRKIAKLRFIDFLLGHHILFKKRCSFYDSSVYAIVGWGRRSSGIRARVWGMRHGMHYFALEDGFLRSYGTGQNFPLLSLVVDKYGIYYDSFEASGLENLLEKSSILDSKIANANHARGLLITSRLSKYNHANNLSDNYFIDSSLQRVLVIDQTVGDLSVSLGSATIETFAAMLDAAITENPSATIYVKTHPEVTLGCKKGYLPLIQDSERVVIIRDDVNPIDLIQKIDKVYVVTSQMGFEALMCGKPVVCFGVPWYAGWGLTDDRVKDSPAWKRRTKKRTVDELFAAAYIHYTRYLNPFTHKRGKIMDVINWLILQKKMAPNPFIRDFTNAKI